VGCSGVSFVRRGLIRVPLLCEQCWGPRAPVACRGPWQFGRASSRFTSPMAAWAESSC